MSDGVDFNIEGFPELLSKLESIQYDMKRKGGRFALRKAAQVIRDSARQKISVHNDPTTPEDIAKNIVERWNGRLFKRTGDLGFRVGVLGGARNYVKTKRNVRDGVAGKQYHVDGDKGNPGGDTYYWKYLEFGTSKMVAKPFMRPAMAQNMQKCVSVFVEQYNKHIDRALKRAQKKKAQQ